MLVGVLGVLACAWVAQGGDCPGGLVRCPDYMTCCELANKEFGCCPFPEAVCCKDHVHCCPQGMQCDVVHQTCQKNGSPRRFYWQLPVHPELVEPVHDAAPDAAPDAAHVTRLEVEDNHLDLTAGLTDPGGKCPDGHPCPDKFTCCKVLDGGYGCCPYSNAVCCTDLIHCCPKGTNCNTTLGTCDVENKLTSVPAFSLKTGKLNHANEKGHVAPEKSQVVKTVGSGSQVVKCPDERYVCPDGSTCCQLVSGAWGCCPMDHAVCCSDHEHCCPAGTECLAGGCLRGQHFIPAPPRAQATQVGFGDVVCPDLVSSCPDDNTCCDVGGGQFGCCPMPQATCCSDDQHCCPNGWDCSPSGCVKKGLSAVPWAALHPPRQNKQAVVGVGSVGSGVQSVVCPDQKQHCPDLNTCCDVGGGRYGCCPMPEATCCGDQQHCCPHGYWCSEEGCERLGTASKALPPFLRKSKLSPTQKREDKVPRVMVMP